MRWRARVTRPSMERDARRRRHGGTPVPTGAESGQKGVGPHILTSERKRGEGSACGMQSGELYLSARIRVHPWFKEIPCREGHVVAGVFIYSELKTAK